jgi:prepilin-type N-terminal cleavage/methylation domain-containing protein
MKPSSLHRTHAGFTLIEALMTIAILGVMAAIVVSAFSNAGTDAARIIARQQQAAVQGAVNAWVNSDGNRTDVINATTGTGKIHTIAEIQTTYNGCANALARLNLISAYLDSTTATYLTTSTTNAAKISSDSLVKSKQYIDMPAWVTGSYPQVTLNPN